MDKYCCSLSLHAAPEQKMLIDDMYYVEQMRGHWDTSSLMYGVLSLHSKSESLQSHIGVAHTHQIRQCFELQESGNNSGGDQIYDAI